jgi:hypothetical protein
LFFFSILKLENLVKKEAEKIPECPAIPTTTSVTCPTITQPTTEQPIKDEEDLVIEEVNINFDSTKSAFVIEQNTESSAVSMEQKKMTKIEAKILANNVANNKTASLIWFNTFLILLISLYYFY